MASRLGRLFLAAVALAILTGRPASVHTQSQIAYRVVDLGVLPGGTYSIPASVNNHGAVVGRANVQYDPINGGGAEHAFFWSDRNGNGVSDPGEMIDLGAPGGLNSEAVGIDDAGDVVGVFTVMTPGGTEQHIFLWRDLNGNGAADPGEMQDLGVGVANGIGNAGDIAATDSYGCDVVISGGVWNTVFGCGVGFFGPGVRYEGDNPINDLGQMVGSYSSGGQFQPYIYDSRQGTRQLLGQPVAGNNASATAINDSGQVIGAGFNTGAFFWKNGQYTEIAPTCQFAEARHLNNLGQVVGVCYDTGGAGHAYLWQDVNGNGISDPGELVDLNTLVPDGTFGFGTRFVDVTAINDAQQIVGAAYLATTGVAAMHAILLTPSALVVTTDKLPDGSVGAAYSASLSAAYGSTPYQWSLAPGSQPLPPGLGIDPARGLILGTPTAAGTFPIVVQATDGASATATRGLTIRVFPFTLSAFGTAAIDGVLRPGEWDHAACVPVAVNVPGGTTPGRLCAMNDSQNLYVALQFNRSAADPGNTLAFEFDNNNNGIAENGDDVFLFNPDVGFADDFRTNQPPCPAGSAPATCAPADLDDGGTTDGAGAFVNDGVFSTYELSHPLNSGDAGHDFALQPGDAVGFFASTRIIVGQDIADTDTPGFRNYARIIVATPGAPTPVGANIVVEPSDPSSGATSVTIAFDDVTQSGTTGAYATSTWPSLPGNFEIGNPPTAFEVWTNATFTDATVCISYAGVTFPGGTPRLMHYENGQWQDVTVSVDTVNQIVCGRVTSFSPFVVGAFAEHTRPVALPDSVATVEDTPLTITLRGVDADNDPLAYAIVAGPRHGSLSGTAPVLTYTPAADFVGRDRIRFRVSDGKRNSAVAAVQITVHPAPMTVTVLSPNGGETFFTGVPQVIEWTATGSPTSFDVALSRNGGDTFAAVAGCTALPGEARSCAWTPKGAATTNAIVRVTAKEPRLKAADTSDAPFMIVVPKIAITAPNAGTLAIGSTATIAWTSDLGPAELVNVDVSRDGAAGPWTPIAANVPNAGTLDWVVAGPATAKARFRISWAKDASVLDVSNGNVRIR